MLSAYTTSNSTSTSTSTSNFVAPTPGSVITARIIMIAHGLLLIAAGAILLGAHDPAFPAALAAASVVEGAIRVIVGILLRRHASSARKAAIVIAAIGVFAGFASGGVGILGGLLGIVVVRCLRTDDAKEHFAAA